MLGRTSLGERSGLSARAASGRRLASLDALPLRVLALLALGLAGCAEGSTDPTGVGGTGATGTGGGAGGSPSAGTGGASGGTGVGGTSAGTGGTGGGTGTALIKTFSFAADTEGWTYVYAEPATLIAPVPVAGDAGADAGSPAPAPEGTATVAHDTVGDPTGDAGSLLLGLPFAAPNQKISIEANIADGATGADLAGRSLTARVRIDSGLTSDPMNPAGLKLYVKTGPESRYADSGFLNILPGSDWQTFTWPNVSNAMFVDMTTPGMHTPIDVRQIGIEFATGSAGVYSAATVHVDTVAY